MASKIDYSVPTFSEKNIKLSERGYYLEKAKNLYCLRALYGYLSGQYKQNEALGKLANMSVNVEDPSSTKRFQEATEYLITNITIDKNDKVNNYHFKNTRCSTLEAIIAFFEGWDDATSRKHFLENCYREKYNGDGSIEDVDIRQISKAFKSCTHGDYFNENEFENIDLDTAFAVNNFKASIIMEFSQNLEL